MSDTLALPAELMELRPIYDNAPRPLTPREALELAGDEYGYRHSNGTWLCLSRGSDGGMHYRDSAYSEAAARGWVGEKTRGLVRRLLSGECTCTCMYDRARDRFYLA